MFNFSFLLASDGKTEEVEMIPVGLNRWREALDDCPTMSRLHILLAMLDSCIKWEKSAENAVRTVLFSVLPAVFLCHGISINGMSNDKVSVFIRTYPFKAPEELPKIKW